jgi:hypothetical protein
MVAQAPAANGTHRPATVANAGQFADGRGTAGAEKRGAVSGQVETVLLRLPLYLADRRSSSRQSRTGRSARPEFALSKRVGLTTHFTR